MDIKASVKAKVEEFRSQFGEKAAEEARKLLDKLKRLRKNPHIDPDKIYVLRLVVRELER